jgi:molybdate transport system substrate-binding protein
MSAPIRGISSMATRSLLADAVGAWHERRGAEVHFESVGGVDAAKRVAGGEAFDVVVLAADAIEALAAAGHLERSSITPLARAHVAAALRRGTARMCLGSVDELRTSLLAVRSVGHSTGPSGRALLALFAQLGIADALRGRLVEAPPGVAVGTLVARGEVELGFQQLSELIDVDGIDIVGPLPAALDIVTTFAGAVTTGSTQPAAARALLEFIHSPAADGFRQQRGLQAPVRTGSPQPASEHS